MTDRNDPMNDRKTNPAAGSKVAPSESIGASTTRTDRPAPGADASRRAPNKFGAAADGWDAYNSWLDRVRQPSPPSRQAVISKSLYSVSSYKNWADKARGAFDKPK
jgi:hypothetical protein